MYALLYIKIKQLFVLFLYVFIMYYVLFIIFVITNDYFVHKINSVPIRHG